MFIDVISTFLRAIRTGVIQVRHGDVLLAHYGRLGPAFDSCTKVIIDILKEEGLSNDNSQLIVLVIIQTMKEVSFLSFSSSFDFDNLVRLSMFSGKQVLRMR